MKKLILILVAMGLLCTAMAAQSAGPVYTGSLSQLAGEVTGVPGSNWIAGNPRLSWAVTWTGTNWNYSYSFGVDKAGGVSHFILETSPTFAANNIWGFSGFSQASIDTWTRDAQGNSNPFMPLAGIYGIKFESFNPTGQYVTIGFNSDRAPVWGDFYVKDGKVGGVENAVWNMGFTGVDTDPSGDPANGSMGYHILRPDSISGPYPPPVVPEPGTIMAALALLSPAGLVLRRRRA